MNVFSSQTRNPADSQGVPLAGSQGELLSITIAVDPRDLERLLDRLGESQHPIDPQIHHAC